MHFFYAQFLLRFFPGSFFPPTPLVADPVPSSAPPAPSGGCQAWLASDRSWADLGDVSAATDVHEAAAAAMRIRKRKSVDDAAEATAALPMCWKFQKAEEWPESVCQQVAGRGSCDAGIPTKPVAVCKPNPSEDVVKARTGDEDLAPKLQKDHQIIMRIDLNAKRLEIDHDRSRSARSGKDTDFGDTQRTKKTSKIEEHKSPDSICEADPTPHDAGRCQGLATMTDAELLAVNELANGIRQRRNAALRDAGPAAVPEKVIMAKSKNPGKNSKDALIHSIFSIFESYGEDGLSASEVVKTMLEQGFPGLKEGGARHTVQVANVLRSSSSFISVGDKRYLLCSTLEHKSDLPAIKLRGSCQIQETSILAKSEDEDSSALHRGKQAGSSSRSKEVVDTNVSPSTKKVEVHDGELLDGMNDFTNCDEGLEEATGGAQEVEIKKVRRRGPLSSQKGKGSIQCKRYDGRGWRCSRFTEPGYSLCVHHQDLINKRAAKLKEAQTLSRTTSSLADRARPQNPEAADSREKDLASNPKIQSSRGGFVAGAPGQKRKLLSLLAIG